MSLASGVARGHEYAIVEYVSVRTYLSKHRKPTLRILEPWIQVFHNYEVLVIYYVAMAKIYESYQIYLCGRLIDAKLRYSDSLPLNIALHG